MAVWLLSMELAWAVLDFLLHVVVVQTAGQKAKSFRHLSGTVPFVSKC